MSMEDVKKAAKMAVQKINQVRFCVLKQKSNDNSLFHVDFKK